MLQSMNATKHSTTTVHLLRHPVTSSSTTPLLVVEGWNGSSPENLEDDVRGMACGGCGRMAATWLAVGGTVMVSRKEGCSLPLSSEDWPASQAAPLLAAAQDEP